MTDRYRQMADHYGTAIVPTRVRKAARQGGSGIGGEHGQQAGDRLSGRGSVHGPGRLNDAIGERVHEIATTSAVPTGPPFRAVHRRGSAGADPAAG